MRKIVREKPLVWVEYVNGLWECYVEKEKEIELWQFRFYENLVSFLKSLGLKLQL